MTAGILFHRFSSELAAWTDDGEAFRRWLAENELPDRRDLRLALLVFVPVDQLPREIPVARLKRDGALIRWRRKESEVQRLEARLRQLEQELVESDTSLQRLRAAWDALSNVSATPQALADAHVQYRDAKVRHSELLHRHRVLEQGWGGAVIARDTARAEWRRARDALEDAVQEWAEANHGALCHPRCPWNDWTIFSRGTTAAVLSQDYQSGQP